ncbi:transcriptional regulator PpsR [Salinarimonas ramus]|uniref:Transcriptional regulator PpsR n=1 Tax=Salinarimonas ramus TaxID=690164 RepID=A0A917QKJ0_9HYPH|nr:transcriptional regulator PpsR [Salinarimonas ramus]GGK55072.1 transcriptional regulator PpsR [Salinarimonas ramus]
MDTPPAPEGLRRFRAPETSLADVDAAGAARLIATTNDLALVLDGDGVIEDVAIGSAELEGEDCSRWLGRRWIDTVTVESREKIEALMRHAGSDDARIWRQVNHPRSTGPDLPILYSAVDVGRSGRIVAVGRDLRGVASLQRKLVDAQAAMEREYAHLRSAETRYRLLFQIATEAVLVVDAATRRVSEANPSATELVASGTPLNGRSLAQLFSPESAGALEDLLAAARTAGRSDEARLKLADGRDALASASVFRQERVTHFLVRLTPPGGGATTLAASRRRVLRVVERLPDALVVTDSDRRILTANAAFLDLVQLATEEQARGEPLDRWLGRSSVDCNVLVASVREHGSVKRFGTLVQGEYGLTEEVEVSAVIAPEAEETYFGFTIRSATPRAASVLGIGGPELPHSVAQMKELVGRVSLKELVRETTDVIEKLCIEAALDLTGDNRASAAEMLGLSRQSFYAKLRRYGLGDLDHED